MVISIILTIAAAAAAYLIGSVNSSILLSRLLGGGDIRESGSGNAGATNMLRTYGKAAGVIVLICDILKGVIAILIARLIAHLMPDLHYRELAEYIAGVAVVLGHDFPCFFGFKGGKGVATSLGVVMMLDYKIGLILLVGAVLVMALTRYVSLGSVLAGMAFIAAEIIKMISKSEFSPVIFICTIILGGMLVFKHRANIKRLLDGTENKLGAKKEDE